MRSCSPTLEGFRLMFRQPSFGLAETGWRWSFGFAAAALLMVSSIEYLKSLLVTPLDLLLLKTRHPLLFSRALRHIFQGSGPRAIVALLILAVTLGMGWILIASYARAATLKSLLAYFHAADDAGVGKPPKQWGMRPVFWLHFLRAVTALAAAISCLGVFFLCGDAARLGKIGSGPAFLLLLCTLMLTWLAWSGLNWFLSVASLFAVAQGESTLGALAAAVNLCRIRPGAVAAVGIWFGIAHITAFVAASSVVALPLSLAPVLPSGFILGGVLLVGLLYSAVADFLYIGRLAGYVAILELPQMPVMQPRIELPPARAVYSPLIDDRSESRVDQTESILSDIPQDN